ncbi:SDR family NAD(P)-dependent oxidoreductase [Phenylobacterium sp. LjRoot225]|uniref:SDR family NAD(P)-dependent oxidoreductase n=1 Tax=Phenylobacterium sp. LjRoot225 TaxID=3342285 RepID=UPI003ED16872
MVLITGGDVGIGLGFARGSRGSRRRRDLGRRQDRNEEAARELEAFGVRVLPQTVDVSDEAQVASAMAAAVEKIGWVDGVGGPGPVVERGRRRLDESKPLEAMHLAEAALAAEPSSLDAPRLKLDATVALLAGSTRENFSEVRWLESEVRRLRAAVEELAR